MATPPASPTDRRDSSPRMMLILSPIMVVAATERELARADWWRPLICGVGPVEAATATAAALATEKPMALLHVGIAGARARAGLAPGTLVIGTESRYCDSNVPAAWAPSTVLPSPVLLDVVTRAFPEAVARPIGTSARVGGGAGCDVEAMEGFGVLRAAERAGVPAIEVRAISNEVEEADRARWHFDLAFEAITRATPTLVTAIREALARA